MSIYLRLGGAGLILLGAILVGREYSAYLNRRLSEYRGLLALLSHAEGVIGRNLSYGRELWRGFEDAALEKCGLLPALREGRGLADAFAECSPRLALSAEAKRRISAAFAGLGRGYKDGEISLLSAIRQDISRELEAESAAAEKNSQVARALLIGGALAVGVMII